MAVGGGRAFVGPRTVTVLTARSFAVSVVY